MSRKRHPNQAIERAIRFAEREAWRFKVPGKSSHAFGILRCPNDAADCRGGVFCQLSVWRAPRHPKAEASKILRAVRKCRYREK